jgi:hypothetical protein
MTTDQSTRDRDNRWANFRRLAKPFKVETYPAVVGQPSNPCVYCKTTDEVVTVIRTTSPVGVKFTGSGKGWVVYAY